MANGKVADVRSHAELPERSTTSALVQNADQIAVMARGKVADVGLPAELSERSTIYNDLMNFQELILAST
eukprot:gene20427-27215_t